MSCLLHLHIVPGSKKNVVAGFHGNAIKIKIQARAVDGKANKALIDFLAEKLSLKTNAISITHGLTSREKIVVIENMEKTEIFKKLGIT
ncbi:MAG: DUF167 domain-containing protein [Verrucomicrobiota bacterium]